MIHYKYKQEVDKLVEYKANGALVEYKKYVEIMKTGTTKTKVANLLKKKDLDGLKKNYIKSKTKGAKVALVGKLLSLLTRKELDELELYIEEKLNNG